MFNPIYYKQVKLLLSTLPLLQRHECFALKGGTAMNLFIQDVPRLSVDIDLAFLPLICQRSVKMHHPRSIQNAPP
jgi:predicted nucleotidyltransferase component of viral defense system